MKTTGSLTPFSNLEAVADDLARIQVFIVDRWDEDGFHAMDDFVTIYVGSDDNSTKLRDLSEHEREFLIDLMILAEILDDTNG